MRLLPLLLLGSLLSGPAWAQAEQAADSLRSYDLAEIVVRGAERQAVSAATTQKVSLAAIARQDAVSVADALRLVPAAHTQTNSRGETLVYLRNAGERQVALFFDGALLNVPWDNRVDLGFVPAGVLGGMTVAKGGTSVLYGTNVLGGVLNLTTRRLDRPGSLTDVTLRGGTGGERQVHTAHLSQGERFGLAAAVDYAERDGFPLPDEARLPFSQPGDDLRTNTDRRQLNLFARGAYRFEGGEAGLSALHVEGEQGVAPESHLDPSADNVRFWRYPLWRNTTLVLNVRRALGEETTFRGAVWAARFQQRIDQYDSAAYDRRVAEQDDLDHTLGTRLTLHRRLGASTLRLALNALTSRHAQQERTLGPVAPPPGGEPTLVYRQHVASLGAEVDVPATDRLDVLVGGSVDAMATPETGDKSSRDPIVDAGLTSGLVYAFTEPLAFRASLARKVRFPTMRELYGEALDRFLLNPGLRPESSILAEAGFVVGLPAVRAEVVAFAQRTYDTIDQEVVEVAGRRLRRRVNLDGSRVVGVEATGDVSPGPAWSFEGHLAWMRARGDEGEESRPLVEKPEWLGRFSAGYQQPGGLSVWLSGTYTGRAYGMAAGGSLEALPTALVVDVRVGYRLRWLARRGVFAEVFGRVDNALDEVLLPQLGLPAPGRAVRAGLNVSW